jgi:hypothetical protein
MGAAAYIGRVGGLAVALNTGPTFNDALQAAAEGKVPMAAGLDMRRTVASAVAALALLFSTPAVACADPAVPQPDIPCSPDFSDAMTLLPDEKVPVVCMDGQWQNVTVPQPPSDRWLSYGPDMTLHGEGRRNPSVRSGKWTATPQDSNSQCRAEQSAVVSAGVVGPPQISEGKPGQPLEFQVVPRMFDLQLSGYCLWERVV